MSRPSSIGQELTCKVYKKRTITIGSINTIRDDPRHQMAMKWWRHQEALAVWVVEEQRIGVTQGSHVSNQRNQRKYSIASVLKALSRLAWKVNKWALQTWTFQTKTVFNNNTERRLTSRIRTHSNPFMSLMPEDLVTQAMVKAKEATRLKTRINTDNINLDRRRTQISVLKNQLVRVIEGVKGMRHPIEECHYKKWITTCMHSKLTGQAMETMRW